MILLRSLAGVLSAEELSALCPHYSVKFNSEGRDRTATCAKFEEYLALAGALNVGCLLVSGSGPRAFDSLALLEALGWAHWAANARALLLIKFPASLPPPYV